jgi:lipopolysaccharide transport system permease protein
MSTESAPHTTYEVIVEPSRGWLNLRWHELWAYRDLLVLLVQRDFISRYKQTILGPLWFILQPVLTTAIFAVVFGRVAGIPTDGIPAPLFYLCGLLGWNYFSQNVTTAGATFVNNSHLFGKVWFPRILMPVSVVVANLVSFALQLIPFFAFALYYRFQPGTAASVQPDWRILLSPLPLLQLAILSLGVSLWISASTAKYRDLVHLTQYLIQLWMFATPIIYPLSRASDKWAWIIHLNPVSAPVEAFRICLLGRGTLSQTDILLSLLLTVILAATGLAAFQKVERTVVDSV